MIRPLHPEDIPALLTLNNAHATELSWQDPGMFNRLLEAASFVRVAADASAFLVAMDEQAAYQGRHFQWFKARYDRFLYIDRVVVAVERRGDGTARALYAALFDHAKVQGRTRLCCEVNVEPPNPASARFHTKLGFHPVGRSMPLDGGKVVDYLVKDAWT